MLNTRNCRPPTYLNIDLITCKVLGFLNLHRIYRNLHKFTPLFEKFTKIYVIYSVNWIWHPAPHPLFPGLGPQHNGANTIGNVLRTCAWMCQSDCLSAALEAIRKEPALFRAIGQTMVDSHTPSKAFNDEPMPLNGEPVPLNGEPVPLNGEPRP